VGLQPLSLAGIAGSNPAGGNGRLSLVSVVCCQVEFSATGRSLDQGSRTDRVSVVKCDQMQQSACTPTVSRQKKSE